jgi:hypothetical protein
MKLLTKYELRNVLRTFSCLYSSKTNSNGQNETLISGHERIVQPTIDTNSGAKIGRTVGEY